MWGAVILLVRKSFETIMAGMVFAILIFLVLTTLAVFKLRKQNVGGDSVFKIPFFPWLPGLYLLGIVALIVLRAVFEWQKSLADLAFIATGIPVSFFWLRRARKKDNP
jgi:APA family basic amino acid/polyamine antiporter